MSKSKQKKTNEDGDVSGEAPELSRESSVSEIETEIVNEAYRLIGVKRSLADLWRLVEKHKTAVSSRLQTQ